MRTQPHCNVNFRLKWRSVNSLVTWQHCSCSSWFDLLRLILLTALCGLSAAIVYWKLLLLLDHIKIWMAGTQLLQLHVQEFFVIIHASNMIGITCTNLSAAHSLLRRASFSLLVFLSFLLFRLFVFHSAQQRQVCVCVYASDKLIFENIHAVSEMNQGSFCLFWEQTRTRTPFLSPQALVITV